GIMLAAIGEIVVCASRADAPVHGAGMGCEQNEGTQAQYHFGNRAANDCADEHGDVLVQEPDCTDRPLNNPPLFRGEQMPREAEVSTLCPKACVGVESRSSRGDVTSCQRLPLALLKRSPSPFPSSVRSRNSSDLKSAPPLEHS